MNPLTTALAIAPKYEYFNIIAYKGVRDSKVVSGFINPKLGRFVCTQNIEWATYDWCEAISLAAQYSYEASRCNEFCVYQHFVVYGIMPRMEYVFLK
jgi:hypothetical protein